MARVFIAGPIIDLHKNVDCASGVDDTDIILERRCFRIGGDPTGAENHSYRRAQIAQRAMRKQSAAITLTAKFCLSIMLPVAAALP